MSSPLCVCLNCRFRNSKSVCTHLKIAYSDEIEESGPYGLIGAGGDKLIYVCDIHDEGGVFYVEDYFGCVHFEQKDGL